MLARKGGKCHAPCRAESATLPATRTVRLTRVTPGTKVCWDGARLWRDGGVELAAFARCFSPSPQSPLMVKFIVAPRQNRLFDIYTRSSPTPPSGDSRAPGTSSYARLCSNSCPPVNSANTSIPKNVGRARIQPHRTRRVSRSKFLSHRVNCVCPRRLFAGLVHGQAELPHFSIQIGPRQPQCRGGR